MGRNTVRYIDKKTAEEVLERDRYCCALCRSNFKLEIHHIHYGINAEYVKERNNSDRLITLCGNCHYSIHNTKGGQGIREACIKYINEIYDII